METKPYQRCYIYEERKFHPKLNHNTRKAKKKIYIVNKLIKRTIFKAFQMPSFYSQGLLHHHSHATCQGATRRSNRNLWQRGPLPLPQKRKEDNRRTKISNYRFEFWLLALIRREMGNPQMKRIPYQMAAVNSSERAETGEGGFHSF